MAAEFDLQQALYDTLSGLAALTAIGAAVVDFGPTDADASTIYPYVGIGQVFMGEWDTDDTAGFDALVRIHSYSNTGSAEQVKDMQGAIYAALHRQDLSVSGYETILCRREDSDVMRTSQGAFHGVCEYRIYLDKA